MDNQQLKIVAYNSETGQLLGLKDNLFQADVDNAKNFEEIEVGPGGGVESVVAGTGISVDDTDPANPVVSAAGGGLIQSASVTLTDAQIKTARVDLPVIVAAPGSGKYIQVIQSIFQLNASAGGYTNRSNDGYWQLYYDDFSYEASGPMQTVNDGRLSGDVIYSVPPVLVTGSGGFSAYCTAIYYGNPDVVNKSVRFLVSNSLGNYTGGNAANTLKVTVYYIEVTL